MKKKLLSVLLASAITVSLLSACSSDHADNNTKTSKKETFLVAREELKDFAWTDLKGKDVLGGRKVGIHLSM